MATKAKPVPDGYHTITPYLVVDGAEKVIRFMKEAFGAQPVFEPMMRPDGKIMHAEFKIGDSIVMISDTSERARVTSDMLYLYVPNVDAVYQKADGEYDFKAPDGAFKAFDHYLNTEDIAYNPDYMISGLLVTLGLPSGFPCCSSCFKSLIKAKEISYVFFPARRQ